MIVNKLSTDEPRNHPSIFIVQEETGAHDPNGVYSAWETRGLAEAEAIRLRGSVSESRSEFIVSEMPFNVSSDHAWNWDEATIAAISAESPLSQN